MFRILALLAAALAPFTLPAHAQERTIDPENLIVMELTHGTVEIEMLPELAPNHVKRIRELVRQGFYNGTPFHRVIDGFMVQGGDPTGTGTGGSGQKLQAEFNKAPHKRGVASMARAADPNSADSQFFLMLADQSSLDGKYTVWGQVVRGMETVDKIKKGDRANNGAVSNPDRILRMRMKADVKE